MAKNFGTTIKDSYFAMFGQFCEQFLDNFLGQFLTNKKQYNYKMA